jgi:hypothetical protein
MALKMRHPNVDRLGEAVSEKQFRQVWAPRGWEVVPAEVVVAIDHFGRSIGSLDELSADELKELADVTGVEVKGNDSKKKIAQQITESPAVAAVAETIDEPAATQEG